MNCREVLKNGHSAHGSVSSNGLQNLYRVNSDFGEFVATGDSELRTTVHEIDALTYLHSMSKTSVFLDALKTTGVNTVESVVSIFTNPIRAIKGLPSGVKKLLSGYARTTERGIRAIVKGGGDEIDPEDFRRSNYLVSNNERNWASELKTDPYSTNRTLRSAISKMSVVQFIGGLPVDFALPLGASLTINIVGEVGDEIYQKSAAELELDNRACLAEIGLTAERIDAFIETLYLTPTMQTVFCATASKLSNVENTSQLAEQLTASDSFNFSRFLISSIGLLTWYHETQGPLKSIVSDDLLPQALTAANQHLVILPVDFLFWTEATAASIERLTRICHHKPKKGHPNLV